MFIKTVLSTLVISFISLPCTAWNPGADCPKLPDDSTKAQILAGRLFEEAEKDYQESRPIEALKGFLCSLQIIQHENTLFNIAQIAKLSEHRTAILALLREFVSSTNGSTKVDPVRELIAELEKKEGEAEPTGGDEDPDDAPPTEVPPPIVSAVPESTASPSEDEDLPPPPENNGLKIAGWTVLGIGAAGLIAGGVMQGLAGSAQGRAETADTYPDFQDAESRMEGLQIGAIAGFAAGGTLIGTGLLLVLLSNRDRDSEQEPSAILLSPGIGGLSLGGRF
jgi:hypothetical protein